MQLVIDIDTANDNDLVMHEAERLLNSKGEEGLDALVDALNGAYADDMRISRGKDTLGRESLVEALSMVDCDGWSAEAKTMLLTGIMKRAMGLKML